MSKIHFYFFDIVPSYMINFFILLAGEILRTLLFQTKFTHYNDQNLNNHTFLVEKFLRASVSGF